MWNLNRLYCESGDNATQSARPAMKTHEPCFSEQKQGSRPVAIGKLVPNAAPDLGGIDGLIGIQFLGLLK